VAVVQDGSREAQALAWHLLDLLPPQALAPHAPALVRQVVHNKDSEALVSVLAKLDLSADREVRAALWEALQSDCWAVRHNALAALEKQPAEALAVHVPALLRGLLSIGDLERDDDEARHEHCLHRLRSRAMMLLQRVKWELAERMQPPLQTLRDRGTPVLVREVAMEVIRLLPPAALAPHVQLLLQALRQPDEGNNYSAMRTRELAADVLLELEAPALVAIVPDLLSAAVVDDVAGDAATFVLSMLPPAMLAEHVSAILPALLFRSCAPGRDGMLIMQHMGLVALEPHAAVFHGPLRHADGNVRRNALALLGAFPSHSIAARSEALRTLLWDSDTVVSKLAAGLLSSQLQIRGLADELTTLLEKPGYAGHRAGVLSALGTLSSPGSAAPPPAAMRLLHDSDPAVRASAIGTLSRLDPAALREHTGLLLTALRDSDARVRATAMEVFVRLPAAALAQYVPTCLQGLHDQTWRVGTAALKALEKVHPAALATHMTLLLDMAMSGHRMRGNAWMVIRRLPPATLAPHLARLLSIFSQVSSGLELKCLEEVVRHVVSSMPSDDVALVLAIELDQDSARRIAALDSVLSHLSPETLALQIQLLMSLTRDSDHRVRASAFRTLSKLEPAELAKIVPALLLAGLIDRDSAVRCAAIGTVCRLPPDVLAPHVARVMRRLWDPESNVREVAMEGIEEMRSQFGAAPKLRQQLRSAAIEACTIAREAVAAGLMC
jgi:hypothetical protein